MNQVKEARKQGSYLGNSRQTDIAGMCGPQGRNDNNSRKTDWSHSKQYRQERRLTDRLKNFFKRFKLVLKISTSILSKPLCYLRQPAVLVSTDSHSMWRGLQSSLGSRSQPEWGMITSSVKACSAWSTISILIESWDERFHRVPGRDNSIR